MTTLILNATLVNEGMERTASVLIEGDTIQHIYAEGITPDVIADEVIDARGMLLLPGVIDDHVHLREPGLSRKADMDSETRAAAAGGVTSVMDMPNVVPQTTTLARWEEKMQWASQHSHVNYAAYLGASNDNLEEIKQMDVTRIPALKLFMGSSTGNMLVEREERLRDIFRECPTLIMTHCEDTTRITQRMAEAKAQTGQEDPSIEWHAWIRDAEACYRSSALAVQLAHETGARLHIAHLTTEQELGLLSRTCTSKASTPRTTSPHCPFECKEFNDQLDLCDNCVCHKQITAEVAPQHLFFNDQDYPQLGSLIKCNPAIKSQRDCHALRWAALQGIIDIIATDHAPHLMEEKQGGAIKAASGMPMIQFSLPLMLTLSHHGILPRARVVEMMCHNPARLFGIVGRGFIRTGYKADLVLLKRERWTVQASDIQSKCGWSPLTGQHMEWRVASTWCNGHRLYDGQQIDTSYYGEALRFQH